MALRTTLVHSPLSANVTSDGSVLIQTSDTNTALACTQLDLASALISDIRRQVYSLGLHKYKPREGLSFLEIQLCRRLFWEIYQSDK